MASSTGRLIRVITLGRLDVTVDGDPQAALPNQRLRCALLVYLAITRECTRDSLVALLWPERTSESARHALSQNLYELRRTLGEGWLDTRGDTLVATAALQSDVADFERAADAGRSAEALGLYNGPFLDGNYLSSSREFDDWVERQRSRLSRIHRRVRRSFVDERIAAGDHAAALRVASTAVARDAADDEMQHQLIALLAATGDRNGALQQYARYTAALDEEGLTPLEETTRLVTSIRDANGDVVASPPSEPLVPPSRFAPPEEHAAYAARAAALAAAALEKGAAPNGAGAIDREPRPVAGENPRDVDQVAAPLHEPAAAGPSELASSPEGSAAEPIAESPASSTTAAATEPVPAQIEGDTAHGALRRKLALAAAVAAIAVIIWAVISPRGGQQAGTGVAARNGGLVQQRLAVLPFENAGAPAGLEYLATQLPIALIHQLRTDLPSLPVVSHYGVLQYAGANVSLDSVARALSATLLVGGSILHGQDGVVVQVHLIDGARGDVLRSAEILRSGIEPLALIGDVVQEVMNFLRAELGRELRLRSWRAGTTSDVAFDLFGRGELQREHWLASAASPDSPAIHYGLDLADSLFAAAELADSNWAEPTLRRARVAEHRAFYAAMRRQPSQHYFEEALGHAERALRIAPGNPAALEEIAAIKYLLWQTLPTDQQLERRHLLAEAETHLAQATAGEGERPSAWSLYSALNFTRGEYHLAYMAAERGYNADYFLSDAFMLLDRLTRAAFEVGQDDVARERCREGQSRFPQQAPFLSCELLLGGWSRYPPLPADSAWSLAGRLIELAPAQLASYYQPTYHAMVAANLARTPGMADSARAVLARAEAWPDRDQQFLPAAAAVHLLLGDTEAALVHLRTFTSEHPVLAWQLLGRRVFTPLRDHPEFERMAGLARD